MEKASTTEQPQGKLPSPFPSWEEMLVLQAVRHEAHGFFKFPQREFISGHSVRKDSTAWQTINKKVFFRREKQSFLSQMTKWQQIWKTQQWPQDWKRSVYIPIAMPKSAQTTAQWHSSHS